MFWLSSQLNSTDGNTGVIWGIGRAHLETSFPLEHTPGTLGLFCCGWKLSKLWNTNIKSIKDCSNEKYKLLQKTDLLKKFTSLVVLEVFLFLNSWKLVVKAVLGWAWKYPFYFCFNMFKMWSVLNHMQMPWHPQISIYRELLLTWEFVDWQRLGYHEVV